MAVSMTDDLIYINSDEIKFFKTEGRLTGAEYGDYNGRVHIVRAFPISAENEYLSVRDSEFKELGIIRNLDAFDKEQSEIIYEELNRRYFAPEIIEVYDVKEEFGRITWNCRTDAGEREFVMRDPANNLIRRGDGGIVLIDIDGNRYTIKNLYALGKKTMRILEIWL